MLTVQALITNPLDWQHFYEKISIIKLGEKTEFTVVTQEGDRLVGSGDIIEVEKWSNHGQYGFKIKVDIKKQKSLTDRRIRGPGKVKVPPTHAGKTLDPEQAIIEQPPTPLTSVTTAMASQDIMAFREMLKSSLSMDMAST